MSLKPYREFMKSMFGRTEGVSDQSRGVPHPPLQLPPAPQAKRIALPAPDSADIKRHDIYACMEHRRSRRQWTRDALPLESVSFLLWATQGVQEVMGDGHATLRPVPSGGARHPFETYLAVHRVEDLEPAVYRYLPLSHELVVHLDPADRKSQLQDAVFGQRFVAESAVAFIWTCLPYRGEWRYMSAAHKTMLLDAGHLCQNLYLACEALGLGTCAVGAYDQNAMDAFLHIEKPSDDRDTEFVVYMAPVGKPR